MKRRKTIFPASRKKERRHIILDAALLARVKKMADTEHRAFSQQATVLLEFALAALENDGAKASGAHHG